ncbi:MAG: hypothetical protein OEZ38_08310 [Gammaproteobacteria bacterium]|nr:hypothetical protein [Gammaproteobacteria bacterium]
MNKPLRYLLQIFNYSVFMALIWYFSLSPTYHQLEENQAMITLTMSHVGKHVRECKKISQQELMKLPPNMRKPMDCPRERSPIIIELLLDDVVIFSKTLPPLGLYKDQGIDIYQNVRVPAGKHHFTIRMNDDVKVEGSVYKHQQDLVLLPEQHLFVEFKSDICGFDLY